MNKIYIVIETYCYDTESNEILAVYDNESAANEHAEKAQAIVMHALLRSESMI